MSRVRSTKMRLRVSNFSISSKLTDDFVEKLASCGMQAAGKIADLSADARVSRGETRAGQQLRRDCKFFRAR